MCSVLNMLHLDIPAKYDEWRFRFFILLFTPSPFFRTVLSIDLEMKVREDFTITGKSRRIS